ncbi:hypothetical protein TMO_0885 [Tistrella mobilis KA081020-065]|uniref:Uncharacterized protein n=1 Tax=Tistrella mobilis (strain KA081020-065) TaxID=1110502 RepID=I3TIY6_TISMK|nr:hypothetical protein TMO_0885 [Tistrella mobilis KA081020-065]
MAAPLGGCYGRCGTAGRPAPERGAGPGSMIRRARVLRRPQPRR